jgi:hypothetical protein
MLDTSFSSYVLVKVAIHSIRAILPLSALWCAAQPFLPATYWAQWPVRVLTYYAASEVAFFVFVYLPRKHYLSTPAKHPPLVPYAERKALFARCKASIGDPESYITRWMRDAPMHEIREENVREFFTWGFFNAAEPSEEHTEELDGYIAEVNELLDTPLKPGRGNAKTIRLTIDNPRMLHRPLLWYTIVAGVDIYNHLALSWLGWSHRRASLTELAMTFPPRPLALLGAPSQSGGLSYWLRPHTSVKHRPVIFIHGIGIGLMSYLPFITSLHAPEGDGEIGILALELMPISFHMTTGSPDRDTFLAQFATILAANPAWGDGFTLVTHSYGSIPTTHLLTSPLATAIAEVVLIDPVTLLLHQPSVAYNFTFRNPRQANEWQLFYFASTDADVAHCLSRRFFWSQNVLWREDLAAWTAATGGTARIFLAGRDLIVDAPQVWKYLAPNATGEEWVEDGLHVFLAPELDHAVIFDTPRRRAKLLKETVAACVRA